MIQKRLQKQISKLIYWLNYSALTWGLTLLVLTVRFFLKTSLEFGPNPIKNPAVNLMDGNTDVNVFKGKTTLRTNLVKGQTPGHAE